MSALKKSRFILPVLLFFGLFNWAYSQSDQENLAEFLILTQTAKNTVTLTCESGCEWEKLTFNLEAGQSQAVDQTGLTTLRTVRPGMKPQVSPFLFNLTRTHNGLSFEGKMGTAWTKLSYTCEFNRCNQYITQFGMAQN